jgi:uncharacterized membrane protein
VAQRRYVSGQEVHLRGKGRLMTIVWIVVVVIALIALFWIISRRRGAA